MTTCRAVKLQFLKLNQTEHWSFYVAPMGCDEFGTWFKADRGWMISRPGQRVVVDNPSVWLLPAQGNYLARFNGALGDGSLPRSDVYVDICTGREQRENELRLIDLDLDVVRSQDGQVQLVDQEEFLEHIGTYGYSMDLVRTAILSSDSIVNALALRREPFDRVGKAWLDQAIGEDR
jgi:uncharacterized protein